MPTSTQSCPIPWRPPALQVVGRQGTCGAQLAASKQCTNATAWAGTSGQWVLEPAGGINLFHIRFNVRGWPAARLSLPAAWVSAGQSGVPTAQPPSQHRPLGGTAACAGAHHVPQAPRFQV